VDAGEIEAADMTEDELRRREVDLGEREARLARAEARLEAAVAAQRESIEARAAEAAEKRRRSDEAAAVRAREAAALRERARELELREAELARRCGAIEELAASGAAPEQVAAAARSFRESLASDPGSVAAVTQELGERERALAAREKALHAREGQLVRQIAELAKRVPDPAAQPPAPTAPPPARPPVPTREAPGPRTQPGLYTIDELRRLVAGCPADLAEAVPDWEAYIEALEGYAREDGQLPSEFDPMVCDVFAPLLDDFG
jgi:hypothetical protein